MAWIDQARRGSACQDKARSIWNGTNYRGPARHGAAGHGVAGLGGARPGWARHGKAIFHN